MTVEDVSVLLLNYNYARCLPRSVTAILAQSVRPREFLIIDDASTDDSAQLLAQLARHDPLVRVIRNEKNLGVEPNVNRGLEMLSGEYVILAAADDYLLPGMIERSMAILRQHPQAGMSCGYFSLVVEATSEVRRNATHWCSAPRYLAPAELAEVMEGAPVPTTSAVFRRDSLLRGGGHFPDLRWRADWFANLVIAFREGICYIPDTLAMMSIHDSSYSSVGRRDPRAQQAILAAILRRLISPEYQDILPFFQDSGVMLRDGATLVRAAASLPERWTPAVLGLISGVGTEIYADLLEDENSEVRALARFFLGPTWMWRRRMDVWAQLRHESDRLRRLQASPVGRLWRFMGRWKNIFGRLTG